MIENLLQVSNFRGFWSIFGQFSEIFVSGSDRVPVLQTRTRHKRRKQPRTAGPDPEAQG